jgi:hypothetical protein
MRAIALIYLNAALWLSHILPGGARRQAPPLPGNPMTSSKSRQDLLQSAREAAGTANVREAVRELTLHALRSRLLTAAHIATVARTVGEGIESSDAGGAGRVRESARGAWTGLEEALERALLALELAAREFSEGGAVLSDADRAQVLGEIEVLARALGAEWSYARSIPEALRARISSVTAHVRRAAGNGAGTASDTAKPAGEIVAAEGRVLSLVASGVLLGLTQPPGERTGRTGS